MTNPTKSITADIARRLNEAGVPEAKHGAKLASWKWWIPAAFFFLLAMVPCGFGVLLAVQDKLTLLGATALAVPTGLLMLATLLCATQASQDGVNKAIAAFLTLGRGARAIAKGQEPPAT